MPQEPNTELQRAINEPEEERFVNGRWQDTSAVDIEGILRYELSELARKTEEHLQDLQAKVERLCTCLKEWEGTGYIQRMNLIEGLNSDAIGLQKPRPKPKRRIEIE